MVALVFFFFLLLIPSWLSLLSPKLARMPPKYETPIPAVDTLEPLPAPGSTGLLVHLTQQLVRPHELPTASLLLVSRLSDLPMGLLANLTNESAEERLQPHGLLGKKSAVLEKRHSLGSLSRVNHPSSEHFRAG